MGIKSEDILPGHARAQNFGDLVTVMKMFQLVYGILLTAPSTVPSRLVPHRGPN